MFGHGGPKTVAEYKKYRVTDTGHHADQEFQAYLAASDADVAARYLQLQNDSFAYGGYSMAQAMTSAGPKAYCIISLVLRWASVRHWAHTTVKNSCF